MSKLLKLRPKEVKKGGANTTETDNEKAST